MELEGIKNKFQNSSYPHHLVQKNLRLYLPYETGLPIFENVNMTIV